MASFVVRRLFLLIPVLLGVVTLVFILIHLIPGDPVDIMLGETASVSDKESLKRELRLDQPIGRQYLEFLTGLAKGDLGRSIHSHRPVLSLLLARYPNTIELALFSMLVAATIAFPLGIFSALKQYSIVDSFSMFFALLGVALPNFWLGPLLILFFSVELNLFPVSGKEGLLDFVLPGITLGLGMSAILTRMIRSSLLEVKNREFILCARAKGLKERVVTVKHALRNALIPVVTVLGLQFGALLAGSIITESIFSWPGIGRLTIQAINSRDYPLVQGCVLLIALSYVFINLGTDLLYGWVDPRIKYHK
ncbi:MAG TPA: nickel ABC transporter permease [Nitrospiria bacterium]|nr:nickel ABC transporter permease [Nitrospiria bacterium]